MKSSVVPRRPRRLRNRWVKKDVWVVALDSMPTSCTCSSTSRVITCPRFCFLFGWFCGGGGGGCFVVVVVVVVVVCFWFACLFVCFVCLFLAVRVLTCTCFFLLLFFFFFVQVIKCPCFFFFSLFKLVLLNGFCCTHVFSRPILRVIICLCFIALRVIMCRYFTALWLKICNCCICLRPKISPAVLPCHLHYAPVLLPYVFKKTAPVLLRH